MSKVVVRTAYAASGKSVGGGFTHYIAKREGVDKTINAKRSEIYTKYIAERPGVVKMGDHGLFGHEDYVNLEKVSKEIHNHKGIVWTEIVSLRQEDAERLGYDTPEAWRNLVRAKQFEIASYHKIPAENMKWYRAFHKAEGHYHMHLIIFNKDPGGEFLSGRDYNRYKDMYIKTMFMDELKQIYDERQSLRDKIIEDAKENLNNFKIDIGQVPDEFQDAFNELKFFLNGYKGKKNYQFISREQKKKVDRVVKVICQDNNLQNLYGQWCQIQLALLKYYHKNPKECFDSLENNLNFRKRLENAVPKSAFKDNRKNDSYADEEQAYSAYCGIVYSICKMFEKSMEQDIKEGFTKSIVDSKDRIKEYKRNTSHGIHMSM